MGNYIGTEGNMGMHVQESEVVNIYRTRRSQGNKRTCGWNIRKRNKIMHRTNCRICIFVVIIIIITISPTSFSRSVSARISLGILLVGESIETLAPSLTK